MSALPLIVLLPFCGAMAVAGLGPRRAGLWVALAVPALAALLLCLAVGPFQMGWLPAAGLSLSLVVDGLSALMAALILGIGLLVIAYAAAYMPVQEAPGLLALLLLFQGAMLGLVLSANLLLLLVFWEATSLASYLLIARRREGEGAARLALILTSGGGLALLAGLLLLGQAAGSFELAEVLAQGAALRASPLCTPALLLIALGCFAKSAQVPLHVWLPAAMVAPAPVSAYLHSATMVTAGVFLLARLWPVFSPVPLWGLLLPAVGLATFLFGAAVALTRPEPKALLAYSTVAHLGLMVALLGLGTEAGLAAALLHLTAHALFKAALFLVAGAVDHAAGPGGLRPRGLGRQMPRLALPAALAAAAMAGLPPTAGFLSKEAALTATGPGWLWAPVVLGSALSVAAAWRILTPFRGTPEPVTTAPRAALWLPPAILAALALLLPVLPLRGVEAAISAVTGQPLAAPLTLWHGLTPALGLSLLAMALGAGIACRGPMRGPGLDGRRLWEAAFAGIARAGHWLTTTRAPLTRSLTGLLVTALAAGGAAFFTAPFVSGDRTELSAGALGWVAFGLLAAGALATLHWREQRLLALLCSGLPGLVVAFWFATHSAPDLALTQIAVELVTVLLLLLALARLGAGGRRVRRPGATAICALAGLALGVLAYAILIRDPVAADYAALTDFFLAQSQPGGGGLNVVNVILVDFRAFDTWGEITVIAIAALTVRAALQGTPLPGLRLTPLPVTAEVTARAILIPALVVACWLFLRGHNAPGGGFVAGLLVAIAGLAPALAGGPQPEPGRPGRLMAVGLLIASGTGLAAWAFGRPFLTSAHGDWLGVPFASALLFDLGVLLTVLGATRLLLGQIAGRE